MTTKLLEVSKLSVKAADKQILQGIDLTIQSGETVAILGPNGAGKSTLARAIMGLDALRCSGKILFEAKDIAKSSVDARARKGLFLSYQSPVEIPGLPLNEVLRAANDARKKKMRLTDFQLKMSEILEELNLSPFVGTRELNVGFSGGEKKKLEIAQMMMLEPKLAMLDEIDSGLDIDAATKMSQSLRNYQKRTNIAYMIITHNMRILQKLKVDRVYVIKSGKLSSTGTKKLLDEIQQNGFKNV